MKTNLTIKNDDDYDDDNRLILLDYEFALFKQDINNTRFVFIY
jgi:hypothetical protein